MGLITIADDITYCPTPVPEALAIWILGHMAIMGNGFAGTETVIVLFGGAHLMLDEGGEWWLGKKDADADG